MDFIPSNMAPYSSCKGSYYQPSLLIQKGLCMSLAVPPLFLLSSLDVEARPGFKTKPDLSQFESRLGLVLHT